MSSNKEEGSKVRRGVADTALGDDDTGRKCWSFGVFSEFIFNLPFYHLLILKRARAIFEEEEN